MLPVDFNLSLAKMWRLHHAVLDINESPMGYQIQE